MELSGRQFICLFVAPSASPTHFAVSAISPQIIVTSWDSPPSADRNGIITSYTLTYQGVERDDSLRNIVVPVVNGSVFEAPELTSLEEDTTYSVSVRASTSVGAGPTSNLIVQTPEDGNTEIY